VINLDHVMSIAPIGSRATIKLIDRDVLTVEHSFNDVADLIARVIGEAPPKPVKRHFGQ
jgi:hypothetical protein